jgi:hypothetical protein
MDNLSFVLWMVLYPVSKSLVRFIDKHSSHKYKDGLNIIFDIINFIIWVSVGILLYNEVI